LRSQPKYQIWIMKYQVTMRENLSSIQIVLSMLIML
jgi:hypothetical protein